MNFNIFQKLSVLYLVGVVIYWLVLQLTGQTASFYNSFYSVLLTLVPMLCGMIGLHKSFMWSPFRSYVGNAVFFISMGLLFWAVGSGIWTFYNIFYGVALPFPSIADIAFALSTVIWIVGMFSLFKIVRFGSRFNDGNFRILLSVFLVVAFVIFYYLTVNIAKFGVIITEEDKHSFLSTFLSVYFPSGDVIIALLTFMLFILSAKYIGGSYKYDWMSFIIGFTLLFVADLGFFYTTNPKVNTFYNGNLVDLLYTLSTFFIAFGVLGFCTKPKQLEQT